MKRVLELSIVATLVIASQTFGGDLHAAFRIARPIELPPRTEESLAVVTLDIAAFAETQSGFADLRVLDEAGREVSLIVRKAESTRSEPRRTYLRVDEFRGRPLDDGSLEIVVALDARRFPDRPAGLRIMTPLVNFERTVRLYDVFVDGAETLIVDGQPLYDYSEFLDARKVDIPIPAAAPGQAGPWKFRLVVDKAVMERSQPEIETTRRLAGGEEVWRTERTRATAKPFRINGVDVYYEGDAVAERRPVNAEYPVVGLRIEEDATSQSTIVYFSCNRAPLTELAIEAEEQNYSREARLEGRLEGADSSEMAPGRRSWGRRVADGRISSLALRGKVEVRPRLACSEARDGAYRLQISNLDSPPISVTGVRCYGPRYEVLFVARPDVEYALTYGNDEMRSPRYDLSAITAMVSAHLTPLEGRLGEPTQLAYRPTSNFGLQRLLNNRWFLAALVATLSALLAWGLYRAARQLPAPHDT
ncbi:MAG: DUF3999 family protein [Planctomycetales bacterium]|nr:DUF3999 family protein [Planctomycetales bacterium]